MSVSSISSSSLFDYTTQSAQNKKQLFQQEFQQLGEDLQSGNVAAAQQDFATLQQYAPQKGSSSSSQGESPIAQAFSQLSQDLQSGNVTAAQQDYSTILQDFQSHAAQGHHHGGNSETSAISQVMQQLGQALQSGNLTSAQQAYSTLQQDFQQFTQNSTALNQASTAPHVTSMSLTA